MKKLFRLLFFPLPAIWLIAICVYWFATSPVPIDRAMVFFSIADVFAVILEYLLTKNKVFQVALIFVALASVASVCSLLWLIVGSSAPVFIFRSLPIFGFLAFIRLLIVEKKDWSVKLANVLSIPIFLFPVCAFEMYYPVTTDTVIFEGHKYILADTVIRDYDNRPMQGLYRCEESTLNCDLLTEHQSGGVGRVNIVVDRKNHVLNLVQYDGLYVSFGKNSEIYWADGARRFGNHIYQMSQECNNLHLVDKYSSSCDSYTRTLYECDLDFTDCHPLPMKYTSVNRDEYFTWDVNKDTHQLMLFSDLLNTAMTEEVLILTYGKHPQCYVDGCQIFGK